MNRRKVQALRELWFEHFRDRGRFPTGSITIRKGCADKQASQHVHWRSEIRSLRPLHSSGSTLAEEGIRQGDPCTFLTCHIMTLPAPSKSTSFAVRDKAIHEAVMRDMYMHSCGGIFSSFANLPAWRYAYPSMQFQDKVDAYHIQGSPMQQITSNMNLQSMSHKAAYCKYILTSRCILYNHRHY